MTQMHAREAGLRMEEGELVEQGEVMEEDPPGPEQDSSSSSSNAAERAAGLVAAALRLTPPVLLPGDTAEVPSNMLRVKLGNGLVSAPSATAPSGAVAVATKAGILRCQAPNLYRIDNNSQRRYISKAEDTVLGVVEDRQAEHYRVNVFGSAPALLPHLAFEGATKRNKPNLKTGALVYGRVAVANKDMDSELSCVVTQGVKKDWMTGESTFGELKGGTLTRCSLGLCRQLLAKDCAVLEALSHVPFEIAVGRNGAFWVHAGADHRTTVAVINCILNSEALRGRGEVQAMVQAVMARAGRRGGGGGGGGGGGVRGGGGA